MFNLKRILFFLSIGWKGAILWTLEKELEKFAQKKVFLCIGSRKSQEFKDIISKGLKK